MTDAIYILALGETIDYYIKDFKKDGTPTIGVNDVWRYTETDYLVVMDPVKPGSPKNPIPGYNDNRMDLYEVIINSRPKIFFSDIDYWKDKVPNFEKIQLIAPFSKQQGNTLQMLKNNQHFLSFSNNSTYTAICLGWSRFKPKRIILFGVDFNTHIFTRHKEIMIKIFTDYFRLAITLGDMGTELILYSKESALAEVLPFIYDPETDWKQEMEERRKQGFIKVKLNEGIN